MTTSNRVAAQSSSYKPWLPDGDVPAPWVVEDSEERCVVRDACGGLVADCTNGFDGDDGWVMSAAVGPLPNIISAAPEMLAVLLKLRRGDLHQRVRPLWDEVQAAIARATGEAQ